MGLLPLLIVWGMRSARLRRRAWSAIAQRDRPPGDGTVWWIVAVGCLIAAAAQPRWGLARSDRLPPGRDVVLLIDDSRSMGAEDAVPNRLGAARESARGLVEALAVAPGNRAAVVAFAGRGVLRCPLTENFGAVLEALDRLQPGDVRPGGTDLAAGIAAALDAFDPQERRDGRTIYVLSDGEDHADRWDQAFPVDRLHRDNVVIHAIAIGDADQGHPVPVPGSAGGGDPTNTSGARPLLYHGETVLTRRVDSPLETIAARSGGAFVRLGLTAADLGALDQSLLEPVALQARASFRSPERIERFPLFVATALGCALIGCRPRRLRQSQHILPLRLRNLFRFSSWIRFRLPKVRARTARRIAAAAALAMIAGAGDTVDGRKSVAQWIGEGIADYQAGRFEEAVATFEAAVRRAPALAVPRYDAAAARYQLGRYDEARAGYLEARARADPDLRVKIDYALGNSAIAAGDYTAAIRHYDDCLASAASGPGLDAVRRDAAINRDFAVEQSRAADSEPNPPPRPEPGGKQNEDRPDPDHSDANSAKQADEKRNAPNKPNFGVEPSPTLRGGPRAGGAGGSGNRDESIRRDAVSPDQILNDALEQIKNARRRRLPDNAAPPDSDTPDDRKDW